MASKTKTNYTASFKPKQVVKRLLAVIDDRSKNVITGRYGLGKETKKRTLESIGEQYDITRERVRQIENAAIKSIQESDVCKKEQPVFEELESIIHKMGGIVPEEELLDALSTSQSIKNHIHFLLVVGNPFVKNKESDEFAHRWHVDYEVSDKIHDSLRSLYKELGEEDLVPESEMIDRFLNKVSDVSTEYRDDEIIKRWLRLSKKIGSNALGEWGKTSSANISSKGIRDYAYLILRKHGSPIHFRDVAKAIEETFEKRAHIATTHNELIKDERFILVGRGLYALRDWGYVPGVVKDVIKHVLEKFGPLTKEEVIEKVLNERYVKENTILVNLQNTDNFNKNTDGKYYIVEEKNSTKTKAPKTKKRKARKASK